MARSDQEERVVYVERERGGSGLGALLIGVAIGAGAALLLAPMTGEETRARLKREARKATRRAKDLVEDLTETVAERVEDTIDEARRVFDDTRRGMSGERTPRN